MNYNFKIITLTLASLLIFSAISTASADTVDPKEQIYKKMIGQMLVVGFRGTEADQDSYIVKEINKNNIGGIILFDNDMPSKKTLKRNIENYDQVKKLVSDIKNYSTSSIFVGVDAEGGYVNRLKEKYGFINIPSAESLGKENPNKTAEQATILGKELNELGFNLDFAPVVDVNVNPQNPVIGYLERSFSDNPFKVAIYASEFIKGLKQENIVPAIKHFPGHGSSTSDSHLGMTDVTKTYQSNEILPYMHLIINGYDDIVMTAHIMNTDIDKDYPATLSPKFIKDILRDKLKFKGVVISDDMQMGAIADHYGSEEAAVKAINAGCDMLIVSNNINIYDEEAPTKIINAVYEAVKKGDINQNRIIQSYIRIKLLKNKYGIK
ncbi:MAG: beta-N-acetylhexosaminidase [Candidatus Pacebacteria bacterium]|nr:beta-N-acetylhexosaminidase [Candidatus Paceibacterota bacterium]